MEITKFGLSRFIYGPLDLATIMFMGKFSKDRCISFGVLGTFIFIIGLLLLTYLSMNKIINHTYGIANRPAFLSWYSYGYHRYSAVHWGF